MAKQKQKGKVNVVALIVFVVVAIVIALGVLAIPSMRASDFALVYDGKYILSSERNVALEKGDEIEVRVFEGNGKLDVSVWAIKNTERNVTFTMADKDFEWNDDVAGAEVTDFFDFEILQPDEKGQGKIKYLSGNELKVIEGFALGNEYEVTNGAAVPGDIFRMDVTIGTTTLYVYFSCVIVPEVIDFDKKQIIF